MSAGDAVSVVIVSWNAREHLARCLEDLSVLAPDSRPGIVREVIVVDNASDDGSAELVARRFPGVRLVRSPTNLGFAGGVNEGARHTSAPLLLLLNPDVRPTSVAIADLAAALCASPGAGAAGGLLVGEDGRPQAGGVRRFPTLATWAVDLLLVDKIWPSNPVSARYFARDLVASGHTPFDVDQPAAACLLVRREAFDALGGFDEQFHPAWLEDVDFCRRLHAAGHRVLLVPGARFLHEGGVAMCRLGPQAYERIWYHNVERYVHKHQGRTAGLVLKVLIVAGMVLRIAWSLVRGSPGRARAYAGVLGQTLGARPRP